MFDSYLNESIISRGIKNKKIKISLYNIKDFVSSGRRADDKPYGGGPGMVLEAMPILRAVNKARGRKKDVKVLIFSAKGKKFDNKYAKAISTKFKHLILICGRYEGIDARVKSILKTEEISIGPYVLTGGEIPAMVVVDAVSRQIPKILGNSESIEENRISCSETYTRPEILEYKGRKYRVPKVLTSGNHKEIDKWREDKHRKST
jgi:tRNA (guanine37-N1)-methyltransferase